MSGLTQLLRPRRTTPDESACINWDHPQAAGLVGLWLPGVTARDFVTGYVGTYRNGPSMVATPLGLGMRCPAGGTAGLTCGTLASWSPQTTLSLLGICTAYGSSSGLPVIVRDGSGERAYGLYQGLAGFASLAGANGGTGPFVLSSSPPTSVLSHVGMTADSTAPRHELYVDGLRVATDTGSFSTVSPGGTVKTTIGWRETGPAGTASDGDIILCAIWNRVLSSNEYAALYDDPFAMLETPSRRFFFSEKVTSGTTQALAGNIDITTALSGTTLSMTYPLAGSTALTTAVSGTTPSITYGLAGSTSVTTAVSGTTLALTYALGGTITQTTSLTGTLSLNGAVTADPNAINFTFRETGHTTTFRERA